MASYSFQRVLVWDVNPGGALRTLRNGQVTVKNATTDATITTVTSDQNGMVEFTTTDVPTVYLVSPAGLVSDHITAASAIESAAGFSVSEDAAVAALVADDGSSTSGALAAAVNTLVTPGSGSATEATLNATYAAKSVEATVAGKVGKGEIVYRAADYANVQAALDAAPASAVVLLPAGNTTHTVPLSITKAVTLRGNTTYGTRIVANGCNGIEVAAGVSDFHMQDIEVASSVRYSTTANTLVGIKVAGSTATRPSNHSYRNVFVDGFQTAFQSSYLWASVFHNFRCGFGLIGMDIYGLSVNNFVGDSSIAVEIVAGSRAVRLAGAESATDATDVGSEGWTIHDSLIYGGEYGVEVTGNAHIDIHDNIIDFCQKVGVLIRDNGTNFGGNVRVAGNYIAMTGASGVAGIQSANAISHAQNTYNRITDNHVVVYSGSTCTYGIYVSGAQGFIMARGNTLKGFSSVDIYMPGCAENVIKDNACLSGLALAIVGINGHRHIIAGNIGGVYVPGGGTSPFAYEMVGGKKVAVGIAAPTVNTWALGDRVVNAQPAVGSPKAWVCTVAGTPGTWVSEGNL